MSLSLTLGTNPAISLDSLADLENAAGSLPSDLKVALVAIEDLNKHLCELPKDFSAQVKYDSGTQSWSPIGGALKFTLSAGVSGKISIVSSGILFSHTTSFPTLMGDGLATKDNPKNTTDITVPEGTAFLALELDFQVSTGAGVTYTSGMYGVSADGSASSTLAIGFYKQCDCTTTLEDAIKQAFQSFVLPLHPQTLKKLKPNDFLHYKFNGKLQIGFGASVGLPSYSYAAQYKEEVSQLANAVGGSASFKPTVQGGVKLAFSGDYSGAFETVVWLSDANTAHLHVYRASQQSNTLGVSAGLTGGANAEASVLVTPAAALDAVTHTMQPALAAAVAHVFSQYESQVTTWATEVNDKIASWLKPLNNLNCALDASISHTQDRFILADYTIDLRATYDKAWSAMVAGRFYDAMALQASGVQLSKGSGLESLYATTATVHLNLMGKLDVQWQDSLVKNAQLIYVGGGIFHLTAVAGRDLTTKFNKSSKQVEIYFAAEADLGDATTTIGDIKLHIILQAVNNKRFGAAIATAVSCLGTGAVTTQLATSVKDLASQPNTSQVLHLIFGMDAYSRLSYSDLKAKPFDETTDVQNFSTFLKACHDLYRDDPGADFKFQGRGLTYPMFRDISITYNGSDPSQAGVHPDRRHFVTANAAVGDVFRDTYHFDLLDMNASLAILAMAVNKLNAGAAYMNLCEDLKGLSKGSMTANASTWESVATDLLKVITVDVDVDYIPATGLALAYTCGTTPATISGPNVSLPAGTSISVTMTY